MQPIKEFDYVHIRRRSCPSTPCRGRQGLLHLVMYFETMIFMWYGWYVSVNYAEVDKCTQSTEKLPIGPLAAADRASCSEAMIFTVRVGCLCELRRSGEVCTNDVEVAHRPHAVADRASCTWLCTREAMISSRS